MERSKSLKLKIYKIIKWSLQVKPGFWDKKDIKVIGVSERKILRKIFEVGTNQELITNWSYKGWNDTMDWYVMGIVKNREIDRRKNK